MSPRGEIAFPIARKKSSCAEFVKRQGRLRARPDFYVMSVQGSVCVTKMEQASSRYVECQPYCGPTDSVHMDSVEHRSAHRESYFPSLYLISSKSVTLSAFVHNPTLPASPKVGSSTSNSCLPLYCTLKRLPLKSMRRPCH